MIPRPYQERAVASVLDQLGRLGETGPSSSTLLVAPTGAGKTYLMALVAREHGGRVLVLQHRDELVSQNRAKFMRVNRQAPTSVYSAAEKRFAPHRPSLDRVSATFAMVPTLCRNLPRMQPVDLVMVDEAHHSLAATWRDTIDRARELNPAVKVFGVTATPNRADRKGLGVVFASVADQIGISELIAEGFLVRPVAHRVGEEFGDYLKSVRKAAGGDYDMNAVAALIDHEPITQAVIREWRAHAGDRQTIVFCATVAHARHVCAAFIAAGVAAGVVTGEDDPAARRETLTALAERRLQVVVNVMALTEGFDDQLISCVVLLRPSCFASTVVQMIGRGLRVIDPAIHPDAGQKTDCQVLDFGSSLERLGGLDQVLELASGARKKREPGPPPMKPCPECRKAIPIQARECALCGYEYPPEPTEQVLIDPEKIKLVPYDLLLAGSKFAWIDLPDRDGKARGRTKIAQGGKSWAIVFKDRAGRWHAFGATAEANQAPRYLRSGSLDEAMSHGDAFLGQHGDAAKYGRGSFFMRQAPSDDQRDFARRLGLRWREGAGMYELMCWITAAVNRAAIKAALEDVLGTLEEAA